MHAGHLRKHLKCTPENFFGLYQCESAYSRAESFETNSGENVHKLQELEDAKENQMLQKAIDHVC